jgi:hypothetical protein
LTVVGFALECDHVFELMNSLIANLNAIAGVKAMR